MWTVGCVRSSQYTWDALRWATPAASYTYLAQNTRTRSPGHSWSLMTPSTRQR